MLLHSSTPMHKHHLLTIWKTSNNPLMNFTIVKLSKRSQTQNIHSVWFHLNKGQKQTKLIFGDRSQNSAGSQGYRYYQRRGMGYWKCPLSWSEGGGYKDKYIYKNPSSSILETCTLYCMHAILQKLNFYAWSLLPTLHAKKSQCSINVCDWMLKYLLNNNIQSTTFI